MATYFDLYGLPIRYTRIKRAALFAPIYPPQEPQKPEKEKEKPKDDPKPESPYFPSARATSPRPEPKFALRYVDGPYRPKPQAPPPEEPKLNWLQRHQSELKKVLLAVTAVAAYVTAQLL